jgi:hypothetical protein
MLNELGVAAYIAKLVIQMAAANPGWGYTRIRGALWILRYFVLFAIDLKTRRVHIGGIVHEAYGQWMEQFGSRTPLSHYA